MLGTLLVLPLTLKYLPVEEASVWLLFSTILSLQILFSFGFSPTFVRAIAYAKADAEKFDELSKLKGHDNGEKFSSAGQDLLVVVSTMRVIYGKIALFSILFFGLIGTASAYVPISSTGDPKIAWASWGIMAMGGVIAVYGGVYENLLEGTENIPILRRWGAIMGSANVAASVLALHMELGLIGLALANQFTSIGSLLINRRVVRTLPFSGALDGKPVIEKSVFKTIWPAAWRSGVGIAMSLGLFQGSALIYAQLAGPREVASYLLALRLVQTVVALANVPFYSSLPTLSRHYRNGDKERVLEISRARATAAIWLYSAAIITIGILGESAITIIGSNTEFVSDTIWWTLGLAFLIERTGALHLQIYTISNNVLWHIVNGFTGLIMIPLMLVLYLNFGVIGFPSAILIAYTAFSLPYSTVHLQKLFNLTLFQLDIGRATGPIIILFIILLHSIMAN